MIDKNEFCEQIKQAVKEFLDRSPPPDYQKNAVQYINIDHVSSLYDSHLNCNRLIGEFETVLDIGSGINFYSHINPNVTTSNPFQRGIGMRELYKFVNDKLNKPVDVDLYDINEHDRWIDTDKQYHAVIAHRFLPWTHKPFTTNAYKRFLRECHRVLLPDGKLFYFTNHRDIFFQQAGEERYIWNEVQYKFLQTTKQQLSEVLI